LNGDVFEKGAFAGARFSQHDKFFQLVDDLNSVFGRDGLAQAPPFAVKKLLQFFKINPSLRLDFLENVDANVNFSKLDRFRHAQNFDVAVASVKVFQIRCGGFGQIKFRPFVFRPGERLRGGFEKRSDGAGGFGDGGDGDGIWHGDGFPIKMKMMRGFGEEYGIVAEASKMAQL
jgi:hypothetical protein